jgi:hypothetical protein
MINKWTTRYGTWEEKLARRVAANRKAGRTRMAMRIAREGPVPLCIKCRKEPVAVWHSSYCKECYRLYRASYRAAKSTGLVPRARFWRAKFLKSHLD